jgi:hypothetical protein
MPYQPAFKRSSPVWLKGRTRPTDEASASDTNFRVRYIMLQLSPRPIETLHRKARAASSGRDFRRDF